jgi:hypothetical protein
VNWRESLQGTIRQGTSAKDAKAPSVAEDLGLLHLLHADYLESWKADSSDEEPDEEAIGRALGVLNALGVRIMRLKGVFTLGVWRRADTPTPRDAIRTVGLAALPVSYLDDPGIPARYRLSCDQR